MNLLKSGKRIKGKNMKFKKVYLLLIIPVVLASIGIIALTTSGNNDALVVSGVVEVTDVDVASKIPGRIDSVYFNEGDFVKKGDIIAKLESKEMDAKVEQARGLMETSEFKYQMALNGARPEERSAVENQYHQAKYQFELAEKTWKRMSSLYKDSLLSAQEKDQYEFQFKAAREQMDAAKAKYDMVIAGARFEEIKMAEGLFHQGQNGLNEALAYASELYIKSPVDGELQKKVSDAGEIISSGYPLFTILDLNDSWVTIQLKEDQMEKISKGKSFSGKVPALGNKEYQFVVSYISPMGEFANWKPTNQKGGFDIKTFEIRLRGKNKIDGLRPGMSVNFNL
jgi:HlyD family secretion protein